MICPAQKRFISYDDNTDSDFDLPRKNGTYATGLAVIRAPDKAHVVDLTGLVISLKERASSSEVIIHDVEHRGHETAHVDADALGKNNAVDIDGEFMRNKRPPSTGVP